MTSADFSRMRGSTVHEDVFGVGACQVTSRVKKNSFRYCREMLRLRYRKRYGKSPWQKLVGTSAFARRIEPPPRRGIRNSYNFAISSISSSELRLAR